MRDTHFYGHIREFAERKAMIARQDAQAWDILAQDILKEKHRIEAEKRNKPASPQMLPPEAAPSLEDRLYVRVKEACKIMGLGRTALYNEINEGRLPIKKANSKTLIAVKDILNNTNVIDHFLFDNLMPLMRVHSLFLCSKNNLKKIL